MLGPFYKEGAPFKQRLGKGVEGERLIITGKVMDMRCQPIKDVILDVWQANSTGEYDNNGFTLRGKVQTNNNGTYIIDTIVPKEYAAGDINRPSHIHLKVGAPNQPTLTTQLYFEGDPYLTDMEDKSLVMKVIDENGTKKANFDFVIEHYDQYEK
jgi:protocatechuate 3,4-dioxygenase beta subunit